MELPNSPPGGCGTHVYHLSYHYRYKWRLTIMMTSSYPFRHWVYEWPISTNTQRCAWTGNPEITALMLNKLGYPDAMKSFVVVISVYKKCDLDQWFSTWHVINSCCQSSDEIFSPLMFRSITLAPTCNINNSIHQTILTYFNLITHTQYN